MNRFDDPSPDAAPPSARAILEDLARLEPRRPSSALRVRVAAALVDPPTVRVPSGDPPRWRWLVERLAWAGGGAVAATLLTGIPGPRDLGTAGRITAAPAPVERAVAALLDPSPESDPEPVAEESLAWSDDGVRYLAEGFPARIYRHWVLERHPDPSGRESLLPREDVFVVPVALR